MADGWVDAAEAARLLGVKPATLYAYVSRGLLTRRRADDGRRSLFDPAELAALHKRSAPDPGAVSFTSAVTALGADRPYYRGRDALALAREAPYEDVAEWLWTGAEHADPSHHHLPWRSLPDAVAAAVAVQAGLPPDLLPLDRLQLIVPTLAVTDPMRYTVDPDAVVATGRTLIAGMVDALPSRSRRKPAKDAGIAERLWPKLTNAPPDDALMRVLGEALVVLADHELAASTVAARVAASVKADPYAVVNAALGVVGGPMHGGASLGAERMFAQMRQPRDAARVIGDRLRQGERIPGVGHPVYKAGDARGAFLLDEVRRAAPRHPRLAVAEATVRELTGRGLPAFNVDFAVATLTGVCGMVTGAGEAIFAVARTAGWLAHALEEYGRRTPMRPRATYVGPPAETG
ncbi:MAG TPA: citrate synthase [Mycobacteriales bacterium]|nr:citrate synthase [Mycobacteriales bacterium]